MTRALAALVALLAAVTACSSSGGKPPGTSSAPSTAASSSVPSSSGANAALAAKLQKGVDGITGETLALDATLLGNKITGSGPAAFSKGELTAIDLTGTIVGSGKLRVILVDGKAYAQVPPGFNGTKKPWLLVDKSSPIVAAQQLALALGGVRNAASLANLVPLVEAAKGLQATGSTYTFTVDATKLPADFPDRSDYAGPLKDSTIKLTVDDRGRPVTIVREFLVNGQKVPVTLSASQFGTPRVIEAPQGDQVFTR